MLALRNPKSKGSQETSRPAALPHTLPSELVPRTGPEMGAITFCGSSIPKTLLCVARFTCPRKSALGK